MLDAQMIMVAASTIQPPHCRYGMNSKISTRKASRVTSNVGKLKIRRKSRKPGECAGPRKWEATARIVHIKVKNAAIGCTMRMLVRECLVLDDNV